VTQTDIDIVAGDRCQSRRGSDGFGDCACQPRLALQARRRDGRVRHFRATGRYSDGANDNTGLGMWGHELAMGTTYGFVKVNYQWETYAQTTTQGSELTILATFLMKPLKLPNP